MSRSLGILCVCWLLLGCRHQPWPVSMRGAMNVLGNMKMSGDVSMAGDLKASLRPDNSASPLAAVHVTAVQAPSHARLAIVEVDGLIVNKYVGGLGAMGENPVAIFREKLDVLSRDTSVRAVVLRINSPGGGVTAADIMRRDLAAFRRQSQVPVVACIMDLGAGGGYYLATEADAVVAHPTSIVGGIGVILNLYNLEDTMGQFNIVPMPVKAGAKIDLASSDRPMAEEERDLLQAMADQFHRRFIDQVKHARPQLDAAANIFDGRVMTGEQAEGCGLVDEVGYLDDALQLARELAHLDGKTPVIMLRRDNDRAFTPLDASPNMPQQNSLLPLRLNGLDRSSLPTFLYLWQPDPTYITAAGG
jgi:protease-4